MFLTHKPLKVVITGKSGSGKTTYFQRLLENGFGPYWKTIFVYDWQSELANRFGIEPAYSIDDLQRKLDTGFIVFDPARDFEGDYEAGLLFFARWTFEVCKSRDDYPPYPRLFSCDELQLLQENRIDHEIQTILQTGRRVGLDMAIVSQQLNELHNKLRAQSTERVTFQHEDPRVLDVMESWGFNPDEVATLSTGQYLYRNDRGEFKTGALFGPSKAVARDEPKEVKEGLDNQGAESVNSPQLAS